MMAISTNVNKTKLKVNNYGIVNQDWQNFAYNMGNMIIAL